MRTKQSKELTVMVIEDGLSQRLEAEKQIVNTSIADLQNAQIVSLRTPWKRKTKTC